MRKKMKYSHITQKKYKKWLRMIRAEDNPEWSASEWIIKYRKRRKKYMEGKRRNKNE